MKRHSRLPKLYAVTDKRILKVVGLSKMTDMSRLPGCVMSHADAIALRNHLRKGGLDAFIRKVGP